jgi:hypothetical protein
MLLKIKKNILAGFDSEKLKYNICYITDDIASEINNKSYQSNYCYSSIFENQNIFLLLDKPYNIKNNSLLNEYKRLLNKDNHVIWIHSEYLEEV